MMRQQKPLKLRFVPLPLVFSLLLCTKAYALPPDPGAFAKMGAEYGLAAVLLPVLLADPKHPKGLYLGLLSTPVAASAAIPLGIISHKKKWDPHKAYLASGALWGFLEGYLTVGLLSGTGGARARMLDPWWAPLLAGSGAALAMGYVTHLTIRDPGDHRVLGIAQGIGVGAGLLGLIGYTAATAFSKSADTTVNGTSVNSAEISRNRLWIPLIASASGHLVG